MGTTVLSIKNVTKTYNSTGNAVHALDGISLEINAGEIFCLLGVNGAGKTTLSSILATLHPPTSGKILFKDVSIYRNLPHYRKSLGFCPQTQNLDTALTVEENLLFAGRYYLLPETTIKKRTHELLERFNLTRYKDFSVNELSGGNKQRLLIARALIHEPEIVILDEPTVGLDPDIRRKLWDILLGLKKQGITVILTTHYLDEAEYLSDRICILDRGKVILLSSVQEIKKQHDMQSLEDIFITITQNQEVS